MVGKKITFKEVPQCKKCKEEAAYFHSCCMAHFEGVIIDGECFIACEVCGKIQGKLEE